MTEDELDLQRRRYPLGAHRPDPVRRSTGELQARYPVGSDITGVVTEVFGSNREYWVQFGDDGAAVEWTGVAPEIGDVRRFRVSRHLMSPRALLLEPV